MQEYTPKHSGEPTNSKNKVVYYILIGIAAAFLLAAIITLCVKFFGGREDFGDYKTHSDVSSTASISLPANPIDFKSIQEQNSDVCAWIQIPGIEVVDYPILQSSPEADDNYYLDHDMNGNAKRAGSIYIQKLNNSDFNDPNTVIYGHNMLNGTMFGQLKKFRNKTFFEENREIYIYTPGHILKYEIISGFVYDNRHILNSFNFDMDDERQEFFNTCVKPSSLTKQVIDGASLELDDKIITLSTCVGNDSQRYLLIGKLVSDTITAQ